MKDKTPKDNNPVFLPAISTFYLQQMGIDWEEIRNDQTRYPGGQFPQGLESGMTGFDFMRPDGYFYYNYALYSAGHAKLHVGPHEKESMIRDRDRENTVLIGDSGGFQIAQGVWMEKWNEPDDPGALAKKETVLRWLEEYFDWSMVLDVPERVVDIKLLENRRNFDDDELENFLVELKKQEDSLKVGTPDTSALREALSHIVHTNVDENKTIFGRERLPKDDKEFIKACRAFANKEKKRWVPKHINPRRNYRESFELIANATEINNEYFVQNRTGDPNKSKFLNVLQGFDNYEYSIEWYNRMKRFSDPNIVGEKHFEGWALGGTNNRSLAKLLKTVMMLRYDGFLKPGYDWIHVLGTSRVAWALALKSIQNGLRESENENIRISFDCASPFLAGANGRFYANSRLESKQENKFSDESDYTDSVWKYTITNPGIDHTALSNLWDISLERAIKELKLFDIEVSKRQHETRSYKNVNLLDDFLEEAHTADEYMIPGYKRNDPKKQNQEEFFNELVTNVESHMLRLKSKKTTSEQFQETEISKRLSIADVCFYGEGDVDRNGKVAKSSWDSLSYLLVMAHNVNLHIDTIQKSFDKFESGKKPPEFKIPSKSQTAITVSEDLEVFIHRMMTTTIRDENHLKELMKEIDSHQSVQEFTRVDSTGDTKLEDFEDLD